MTRSDDPYQQGWSAGPGNADYPPVGYNPNWPPPDPYDGVPHGYAVHPMYPGIPGQGPQVPAKSSRPWILIASVASALAVVVAVVLVFVISDHRSAPRRIDAAPSASPSYLEPAELPTASGGPPVVAAPAPPSIAGPPPQALPPQAPPPEAAVPKAPGQVLAVGECVNLTPPSGYKPIACTDPEAVFKVFDVVAGGTCKAGQTGFTAGNFSYCIAPQLRVGSCYATGQVMGQTVFVAAPTCREKGAFPVLMLIPGTTESRQCMGKPGVVHSFVVQDPPSVICTGEFAS